jgi:hypothetical protein
MNKVLIKNVSKDDANKLVSWWNANTSYYHFKQKSVGKLYNIIRYV